MVTTKDVLRTTVPDILHGTQCGRITSVDHRLIGGRVVHEEHFGTIYYVGELPNSTDVWLGINWDNPNRGRHNGTYKGHQYFRAETETSGSFVRPDKVSLGTSLEEALVYRYVLCAECQLSAQKLDLLINPTLATLTDCSSEVTNNPVRETASFGATLGCDEMEYSGSHEGLTQPVRIELFTNRSQLQAASAISHQHCGPQGVPTTLKTLRSAVFTLVPIHRALRGPPNSETASLWPLPGGTLGEFLPKLTELDLSGCLLSRWIDVAEMCVQLPRLKSLNLNSNHLRLPLPVCSEIPTKSKESVLRLRCDLDSEPESSEQLFSRAFPELQQLLLVRSPFLNWIDLARIMKWVPSLKSLSVAHNKLGNLPNDLPEHFVRRFRQLTELDLTQVGITELDNLFAIIGPSNQLHTVHLNQNEIATFPELPMSDVIPPSITSNHGAQLTKTDPFTPSTWFQSLRTLGLKCAQFGDWQALRQLLRLPKLEHLLFADCPIMSRTSEQTARQEVIARLPSLSLLNRIEICADERRGAELDYLKRYGALWRSSGGAPSASIPDTGDKSYVSMDPVFANEHPVFGRLCSKYGIPDDGEFKQVTHSLKEGLTSITFVLDNPKTANCPTDVSTQQNVVRRLHGRMTVGHLRMMVRRLFKLPPAVSYDLVVQGERHRKINSEVLLDADTRELGFYCLEDGDVIFVRLHN
ncbi:tubulin-specific chaperone E [Paragonimus westermani]|uniref:Tubulin-specific chaperone E n=1 Tax=Paragonimus westermani TaxID=34504 RepID=A0A5J4NJQ3_9TREM|nr:tubulin-specific chaperone E [Paragonimus westermani]